VVKPESLMDAYLPIFVMLVLGLLFAALSLVASIMLAPRRKPTDAKVAPYECGIVPDKAPAERFPVRFYLVAMIFIIFDIEIVFLYPWAVVFHQLGSFGFVEILVFAGAVFISFLYLVSNGALDWGPVKRIIPAGSSQTRTTRSTVVRIAADPEAEEAA
jgi:NADH-quinone oxidoreductase subunit A